MQFTQYLWQQTEGVYQQILDHPFNQELMQGVLNKDSFKFYIQQDSLYLHDFGRALATLASRSLTPGYLQQFAQFAEGAVVVEKALHEQYFSEFGIREAGTKSPACQHYTSFLLAQAGYEDFPVGMAALLPCFWIYREVGNHIYQYAKTDNPYQAWIDTYAGEEFSDLVDKALTITDELADSASETVKEQMTEAFIYSTKLEWLFWHSAYHQQGWPV